MEEVVNRPQFPWREVAQSLGAYEKDGFRVVGFATVLGDGGEQVVRLRLEPKDVRR